MKIKRKIHLDYLEIKTAKCGIKVSKNVRLTTKIEKITCKNCLQSIIKWNRELIKQAMLTVDVWHKENCEARKQIQKLEGVNCQK